MNRLRHTALPLACNYRASETRAFVEIREQANTAATIFFGNGVCIEQVTSVHLNENFALFLFFSNPQNPPFKKKKIFCFVFSQVYCIALSGLELTV